MNTSLRLLDQRVNKILDMVTTTPPSRLPSASRPKTKLTSFPKRTDASKLQLAVSFTAFLKKCLSNATLQAQYRLKLKRSNDTFIV